MALIRLTNRLPQSLFSDGFLDEIPERLRHMFGSSMERGQPVGWMPAMEIVEDKNALIVTAELPGLAATDVEISVDDGVLTVSGEKHEEKMEGTEESEHYLFERRYGSFRRSFTLPNTVDVEKINAEFDNGVLKVMLPKNDKAKAKGKKIDVHTKK
jgi:HSP20 family molecular chaperone IbpA